MFIYFCFYFYDRAFMHRSVINLIYPSFNKTFLNFILYFISFLFIIYGNKK